MDNKIIVSELRKIASFFIFAEHEDAIFNKKVQRVKKIVFDNDPTIFQKTMWRMSRGSRTKAIELAKGQLSRYGFDIDDKDFEAIFDNAVAELAGDGCEIEWLSE